MRPTNGEIRNALASAQAIAWASEKISVRLQSMPSRCRTRGGLRAFPGRGDLDEDALAPDAARLVVGDQRLGLGDRAGGVEGEIGVDLGRDAAGHDSGQLGAEIDRQAIGHGAGRRAALARPRRPLRRRDAHRPAIARP